jgi:hypothetical protein
LSHLFSHLRQQAPFHTVNTNTKQNTCIKAFYCTVYNYVNVAINKSNAGESLTVSSIISKFPYRYITI